MESITLLLLNQDYILLILTSAKLCLNAAIRFGYSNVRIGMLVYIFSQFLPDSCNVIAFRTSEIYLNHLQNI